MSISQTNFQSIAAPSVVLAQNPSQQLPKTDSLCERCLSCFTTALVHLNSSLGNKPLPRGSSKEDLLSVQTSELRSSVTAIVKKEGSPLQRHRKSPLPISYFNPEPPFYGYSGSYFIR